MDFLAKVVKNGFVLLGALILVLLLLLAGGAVGVFAALTHVGDQPVKTLPQK